MTDTWATVASLATAGGTLVLAIATFAAVRSASRAARATERALQVGIRPVLATTRFEDATQKISFLDRWVKVEGGRAFVDVTDEAIYLVIPIRNVGNGIAVLDRWDFRVYREDEERAHGDPATFRRLTRDIFVAPSDIGFWQGALRDPEEPAFAEVRQAIEQRQRLLIDVLYADHEGGQRTITRWGLTPHESGVWLPTVTAHWNLDRDDPR
ncbi:MAG: hypothetical protein QOD30_949 [Actinomycetota bacterium]|nr:hypothetical protein [Actinomycetota bacterium]